MRPFTQDCVARPPNGAVEARRDDWFLRADGQAALTGNDADTPGGGFGGATLRSDAYFLSLAVGRTLYRGESAQLDALVGARGWLIHTELDLEAGTAPAASVSHDETFVSPLVGLSGAVALSECWSAFASGSVGGSGLGADLDAGATLGVSYAAGESWGVVGGYRIIRLDHEDDGFVYDLTQNDPFLGACFDF